MGASPTGKRIYHSGEEGWGGVYSTSVANKSSIMVVQIHRDRLFPRDYVLVDEMELLIESGVDHCQCLRMNKIEKQNEPHAFASRSYLAHFFAG
jgi:hypothetical protein